MPVVHDQRAGTQRPVASLLIRYARPAGCPVQLTWIGRSAPYRYSRSTAPVPMSQAASTSLDTPSTAKSHAAPPRSHTRLPFRSSCAAC